MMSGCFYIRRVCHKEYTLCNAETVVWHCPVCTQHFEAATLMTTSDLPLESREASCRYVILDQKTGDLHPFQLSRLVRCLVALCISMDHCHNIRANKLKLITTLEPTYQLDQSCLAIQATQPEATSLVQSHETNDHDAIPNIATL